MLMRTGVGDLMAAKFNLPEKIIGMGDLVPALFHSPEMTMRSSPTAAMGELVPAWFSSPEMTIVGIPRTNLSGFTDTWTWKEYAAIGGGLLLMAWYFTEGRKMFRARRERPAPAAA